MMNPNSTQKQEEKQTNKIKHRQRSAFKPIKKPLIKQAWLSSSKKTKNNHQSKVHKDYASQSVLKCMTVGIVLKYKQCSPNFQYNSHLHPRRILTKPSEPAGNNDFDNVENNLLLAANDVLNGRYLVKELLGTGTFGQVVRCEDLKNRGTHVAIKVIKNHPAYRRQAKIETDILKKLMEEDYEDKYNIVRMHDFFEYRNHLCIIFELLSINLYELIKSNRFQGLSTNLISIFSKQVLDTLCLLQKLGVMHCDLKPENILLTDITQQQSKIKVIDFGSACRQNQTMYSYIQSRFYRSPEVLFGLDYDLEIDMWSLGCICAELFLGLPLFPGHSEHNQVCRIVEVLGEPPLWMLQQGKNTSKFYKRVPCGNDQLKYVLKTEEEYCIDFNLQPKESKKYFNYTKLDDLILNYSGSLNKYAEKKTEEEINIRQAFLDFVKGLLKWEPSKRWTARQAINHPFITRAPFTAPYKPEPDFTFQQKRKNIPMSYAQPNNLHQRKGNWINPSHFSYENQNQFFNHMSLGMSPNTNLFASPNTPGMAFNMSPYGLSPHFMPSFGTPNSSFGSYQAPSHLGFLGPSPSSHQFHRQYQQNFQPQLPPQHNWQQPQHYQKHKPHQKRRSSFNKSNEYPNQQDIQRGRAYSWHTINYQPQPRKENKPKRHYSQYVPKNATPGKPPKPPRHKSKKIYAPNTPNTPNTPNVPNIPNAPNTPNERETFPKMVAKEILNEGTKESSQESPSSETDYSNAIFDEFMWEEEGEVPQTESYNPYFQTSKPNQFNLPSQFKNDTVTNVPEQRGFSEIFSTSFINPNSLPHHYGGMRSYDSPGSYNDSRNTYKQKKKPPNHSNHS